MAQTESQLEIYKIILGRKTVRQIIREKAEADEITINTDIEYSNYLFRKLLKVSSINSIYPLVSDSRTL